MMKVQLFDDDDIVQTKMSMSIVFSNDETHFFVVVVLILIDFDD